MKLQQSECLGGDNNSNRLMAVGRVAGGRPWIGSGLEMMGRGDREALGLSRTIHSSKITHSAAA